MESEASPAAELRRVRMEQIGVTTQRDSDSVQCAGQKAKTGFLKLCKKKKKDSILKQKQQNKVISIQGQDPKKFFSCPLVSPLFRSYSSRCDKSHGCDFSDISMR